MDAKKLEKEMIEELIRQAFDAQTKAYVPNTKFTVGAALLSRCGKIYQGCNIENAAYTPTNCAERTAVFTAITDGAMEFDAIAIVGNRMFVRKGEGDYCPPCGVCRQVLQEFCDPETFQIILAKSETDYRIYKLKELLPLGFGPEDLC